MSDADLVHALREIRRLAGEVAAAASGEHLQLRNRAVEIAGMADVMLWSVAPDESRWLDDVYATWEAS